MKGLMVALLTLLTAGFANAQQQGQNDEGGTFVLKLTGPQFRNLLDNPEGLIATIPEDARGDVTKVVVKLAPDVRTREFERIINSKPGVPQTGATIPALQPTLGGQSTQSPFRASPTNSGNANPVNTNPSTVPEFNTPGRVALAGGQPLGGNINDQPLGGNTDQPWLEFGDDSDFIPVVRRNQWIQPPARANHLANNDFNRELNDFRNPNQRTNGQDLSTPGLNQNNGGGFQNRDRTLDVARRNPSQPAFNEVRRTEFNNGNGQSQPVSQNSELVQSLQNQLQQNQLFIEQQKLAMQKQQYEIDNLKLAQQSNSRQSNLGISPGFNNNRNFQQTLENPQFENPPQNRLASNRPLSTNGPQVRNVDNTNTENGDQPSTGDASTVVAQPSQELIGKNRDLAKANTFLLFMLLCSIGLNIYLGLIARSFYMRYAELADELRETFTATM